MGYIQTDKPRPTWNFAIVLAISIALFGVRGVTDYAAQLQQYSGAWLIPYYVFLWIMVAPAVYVQLKLGGMAQRGIVGTLGAYIPILKGAGVACLIRIFFESVTMSFTSSLSVYYMFASLATPFPWMPDLNSTDPVKLEMTPEVFLEKDVLQMSAGISQEGVFPWYLPLCLLAVWVVIYLSVCGGVRWFAWTVSMLSFTAMILCIALFALAREELDHGYYEHILYSPVLSKLTEKAKPHGLVMVWVETLAFTAYISATWFGVVPTIGKNMGPGMGKTLIGLGGLFLGLALIPHLFINLMGSYVYALVRKGGFKLDIIFREDSLRLLFVVFPSLFTNLGLSRGVAVVFYLMMALFNIVRQALFTYVIVDNLVDGFRKYSKKRMRTKHGTFVLASAVYSVIAFLLCLPTVTQGGYYLTHLTYYAMDRLQFIIVIFLALALMLAFSHRHSNKGERAVAIIFLALGGIITACALGYLQRFDLEPKHLMTGGQDGVIYNYPSWAYLVHWLIAAAPVGIGFVFGAMHAIGAASGTGCQRLKNAFKISKPSDEDGYTNYTNVELKG